MIETQDVDLETAEVLNAARSNLDFLAALSLPEVYKYAFPPLYRAMWGWLCEQIAKKRDFSQLAIGLPRGFGKTLLIKLFVLYTILFTDKKFILIFSETVEKSISIVSDVFDMLDEPNIKAVFGDWNAGKQVDNQVKKVFGFRGRNIIVKAAGASSGVRGITEKNVRPDLMIFDDIQSREGSESVLISAELEKWLFGTAMKTKSPEGCLFVFIANMYPTKGSLLRKLKLNDDWIKFIVGGITEACESLWEELQPLKQLLREFRNDLNAGHPEIFYAEVLNDENAALNNVIDLSLIPDYKFKPDDICQGKFLVVDPSSDKANSDLVSIIYYEVWDGVPYAREILEGRFSPGDIIRESIKLMQRTGTSLCAIEAQGFQYSLQYWFAFICEQMGIIGLEAVPVYSGMVTKGTRILAMFRQLTKGEIGLHPDVRPQVYIQATSFNPLRRDNTDGVLDCLTYAPKVMELYGIQIMNASIISEQEFGSMEVLEYNSPF